MSIPRLSLPPKEGGCYIIPQYEGEKISIPGSKSVLRILTSELQNNAFSVFAMDGALADAPGFHHHEEAHDIFMVTKGEMQLWAGDECKILSPGDFASVPPKFIHNPKPLGPITETFGLISPANWVDFFRYITENYDGILYPEMDTRDLKKILIPKVMSAEPGRFDVHFHPHHKGCEVSGWSEANHKLPSGTEPYFLRANTGPRWILDGVISRPFITTAQSDGKFAISSIEGSAVSATNPFADGVHFSDVDHIFIIFEGVLEVSTSDSQPSDIVQGETVFIAKGTKFSLRFKSRFVRFWSFSTGDGIESLIHKSGKTLEGYVLPDPS